ncbi:MAG: hypothetical protein WKF84_08305 [Pyrinomonadaceae bacterium]
MGVFLVQSPLADTISIGRGAIIAAISTLNVPSRRFGAFSQGEPPCMMARDHIHRGGEFDALVNSG